MDDRDLNQVVMDTGNAAETLISPAFAVDLCRAGFIPSKAREGNVNPRIRPMRVRGVGGAEKLCDLFFAVQMFVGDLNVGIKTYLFVHPRITTRVLICLTDIRALNDQGCTLKEAAPPGVGNAMQAIPVAHLRRNLTYVNTNYE